MFIRAVFALALLWFTVPGFCGYSTVLETIFATPYIVSNIQFNTTQRPDKSWNDTITFEVTSNHTQSSTFCWVSFSNIAPPPTTFFPCDHSPTNDTSFRVKFNTSFADWNANPSVIHPFTLGISNAWESV
ncbi:MAG: hypothetical protein M1838_004855 [Thelocarpon superellum]|nr:MAG: hypothetical protein M1838_004855 [Thelocarpon superellum]